MATKTLDIKLAVLGLHAFPTATEIDLQQHESFPHNLVLQGVTGLPRDGLTLEGNAMLGDEGPDELPRFLWLAELTGIFPVYDGIAHFVGGIYRHGKELKPLDLTGPYKRTDNPHFNAGTIVFGRMMPTQDVYSLLRNA